MRGSVWQICRAASRDASSSTTSAAGACEADHHEPGRRVALSGSAALLAAAASACLRPQAAEAIQGLTAGRLPGLPPPLLASCDLSLPVVVHLCCVCVRAPCCFTILCWACTEARQLCKLNLDLTCLLPKSCACNALDMARACCIEPFPLQRT